MFITNLEEKIMDEDVNVAKLFVRFHAHIEKLERDVNSGGVASNMGIAQRLARHLRRRAASHNPKRIPRSIREKMTSIRVKAEAAGYLI